MSITILYNATHGGFADLFECWKGLNYVATEPVRHLHKVWNSFFEKNSATNFLMICHSQGVIHTRNALIDYPVDLRERILVLAIAPGGYVYHQTCAKVIHYRAKALRGGVPRLDVCGERRSKDSIRTLDSHPSAKAFDHEFTSPTYRNVLKEHIKTYIGNRGEHL